METMHRSSRAIAVLAVLALAWALAGAEALGAAQDEEPQEQVEALGRVLGMTPEQIEALDLSPEEVENLLAGFTEETVVVGSRAQPHGDRVTGAGRRAVDDRADQPGCHQPAGPTPDGGPVVQRQHAADQRRLDGRPAGDAAQPGPEPHPGAGQR